MYTLCTYCVFDVTMTLICLQTCTRNEASSIVVVTCMNNEDTVNDTQTEADTNQSRDQVSHDQVSHDQQSHDQTNQD